MRNGKGNSKEFSFTFPFDLREFTYHRLTSERMSASGPELLIGVLVFMKSPTAASTFLWWCPAPVQLLVPLLATTFPLLLPRDAAGTGEGAGCVLSAWLWQSTSIPPQQQIGDFDLPGSSRCLQEADSVSL